MNAQTAKDFADNTGFTSYMLNRLPEMLAFSTLLCVATTLAANSEIAKNFTTPAQTISKSTQGQKIGSDFYRKINKLDTNTHKL